MTADTATEMGENPRSAGGGYRSLYHRGRSIQSPCKRVYLRRGASGVLRLHRLEDSRQRHRGIGRPRRVQHMPEPRAIGYSAGEQQLLLNRTRCLVHQL